jgi:hypothetical protein
MRLLHRRGVGFFFTSRLRKSPTFAFFAPECRPTHLKHVRADE